MNTDMFQKIKSVVLDMLFPAMCVGEHGFVAPEGRYICEQCSLYMGEAALMCPVCGQSSFTGKTHKNCSGRYVLDGLVNIWEYEGVVKKLLNAIKYNSVTHATQEVTHKAFGVMTEDTKRFELFLEFLLTRDPVISYVPMAKRHERKRGYNQARVFAEQLAGFVRTSNRFSKATSLLKKVKNTVSQTKLKKEERLLNVRDAFAPNDIVMPKHVVLVDDVWTTGATMKECCKTLKKAGVKEVWGFAIARTP
ncbi:MAG: phosphoribosyltransferase family protein [bacterium]|nr:phosphoribosyltransferase family protein [bacterium]